MGIAWKVVVGLVLLLPMTAYVVGSLVAAAEEPQQHQPIIVEERTQAPKKPGPSPSEKPTKEPSPDKTDHHGGDDGDDGDDDGPQVITPSPSVFDDNGGEDNSGKGSGDDDDSSGKGSGHD